ncbi:MAG: DUF106 domain-containing protein [Halosimplex sp.]
MDGEQLEALLDSPAMREAVRVVFERTQGGTEELNWSDVNDALSPGQWGRLLESSVLVGAGSGFAVAHPERIEERLAGDGTGRDGSGTGADPELDEESATAGESDELEPVSWEWYDKAAALGAVALFTGEFSANVRDIVASVDNAILAPVTHVLPFFVVVLLLSIVTGLYSSLLQTKLTDAEKREAFQERMEAINERKEAAKERGDDEALEEIQDEQMEAMGDQLGMFKLQFRPMVWIMLLTVPVYLWLRWKVRGGHLGADETGMILPLAGAVTWQQTVGPMPAWIVWYFLCSMSFRQIIQKSLGLRPSSTS